MTPAPDTLTLKHHRDRDGWHGPWVRRIGIAVLAAIAMLALANVFGQRPSTSSASTAHAKLELYAPARVRSGLMYSARVTIEAVQDIKKATLILGPGWADQFTVNGITPQPISEGSDNGKLTFTLGHIPQGKHYTLFLSLQVNPTNVGHHAQTVWLDDGQRQLAVIHHEITIWP